MVLGTIVDLELCFVLFLIRRKSLKIKDEHGGGKKHNCEKDKTM